MSEPTHPDERTAETGEASHTDSSMWDRLAQLPDLGDAPLDEDWVRPRPGPVETGGAAPPPAGAPSSTGTPAQAPPAPDVDQRRFRVGPSPAAPSAPPSPPPWPPAEAPVTPVPMPDAERLRRRRRRRTLVLVAVLVPLLLVGAGLLYSWYLWSKVDKIDTEDALSSGSDGFTNYLIVGVDSREGVDPSLGPQVGLRAGNNLSDTMLVLHIGDAGDRLVSLPRDLWVPIDGGAPAKLNAAGPRGAPALIRTITSELDVPIHHYLEVNIAGFLSVIDAVGSITITFDQPACDPKSKLDVRETGEVQLGSAQALAYVRSRTYTEFDAAAAQGLDCDELRAAGLGNTAGDADFGRTRRQREFLTAVFGKVSGTRNPVTLLRVLDGLTGGLRVDDTMGAFDAFGLFRDLRGLGGEPLAVPVSDFAAPDGSAALTLNGQSDEVLDLLRRDVANPDVADPE